MSMNKLVVIFGCIGCILLSAATNAQQSSLKSKADSVVAEVQDDGNVSIKIGDTIYKVAYADEPHERQLGLMYRRKMCDDCGMLFKFDTVRTASIWMKNTYIPLDLAYITEDGEIIDIKALTPLDETSVRSSKPVRYALEMNQGWFGKKSIRVGDKVSMLP